ncbi:Diacylglycerol kinase [Pirellula sp. SH-Sr6A]|uniref:diacylglycerol/lipid kinase family protein n=1 Tax=Pirellula sp. SH-Sr6A TaxID=1632865 RepID=UPI00078E6F6D|nr:diacylglycerol kinase family protein [Pirellula sp. SH-Sr6A]AMV34234.1 Diacylglycerol kinase [Pirellula sp. SH-Sr6A]
MKTVLIAANPKSGNTDRMELVEALARHLTVDGYHAEIVSELEKLQGRILCLHAEGELHAVVAAGGDGTVSAVATRTPTETPIAILPLGSENLLAHYYGIPRNPSHCAKAIAKRDLRILDAMEVQGTISLLMASVGFDAEVVRRVHQHRKSHITRWAYRYQAWCTWCTYSWPKLDVTISQSVGDGFDSNSTTYPSQWCFVFNVPRYAAGLSIIERSDPSDGKLDVGLFEKSGPIRGLMQFWDVLRGRHMQRPDWRHLSACEIDIRLATKSSGEASVQLDGDWAGLLPIRIRIAPQRVRLIV